jgi:hypothetical protein
VSRRERLRHHGVCERLQGGVALLAYADVGRIDPLHRSRQQLVEVSEHPDREPPKLLDHPP